MKPTRVRHIFILLCSLNVLFSPLFGVASEPEYPYRDLKKPIIQLDDDIVIYHLSATRTGSTLVTNILKYLFEDKSSVFCSATSRVIKGHGFNNIAISHLKGKRVILSTSRRDPMGIAASWKRIGSQFYTITDPIIHVANVNVIKQLYFKYEEFKNDNFDYILKKIEDSLNLKIPHPIKEKVNIIFSKPRMQKIQQNYTDFSQYDQITGIHGKHIGDQPWQTVLSKEEAELVYTNNIDLRRKWGYPEIDVEAEWKKYHDKHTN